MAGISLNGLGLFLLTVGTLSDVGVPVIILGLVGFWELAWRWRRVRNEHTLGAILNTVIAILLLAAVMFGIAAAVPAATNALGLGIVILLIGFGLGLYEAWTWRKEIEGRAGETTTDARVSERPRTSEADRPDPGCHPRHSRGHRGDHRPHHQPGPLFLLGIAAVTAAIFAFTLRGRNGPGRPW